MPNNREGPRLQKYPSVEIENARSEREGFLLDEDVEQRGIESDVDVRYWLGVLTNSC